MPLAHSDLGSGPPLVLLHAFPLDRGMWETAETAGRPFRLITIDLPGFGESPSIQDSPWIPLRIGSRN